jgi:hypothetical protein
MSENSDERRPLEWTMSRRNFMVGSVASGTAAGWLVLTQTQLHVELMDRLEKRPFKERLLSEALSNRRSGIRTAIESVFVWAANIGVGMLADRLKIAHGGHAADGEHYEEQLEESPYTVFARDNFLIPIIEEALFRLLPSAFFSEEKSPDVKLHWKTGLASTVVFAAIHNFSKPEHNKIRIHLNSMPLEQLILGAYCWYAQRRGGFVHAAGAHIFYNNLCEAYYQFFEKHRLDATDD